METDCRQLCTGQQLIISVLIWADHETKHAAVCITGDLNKIPLSIYLIPSNQIIDTFLICLQTMLQQWIVHPRLPIQ